MKGLHPVTRKRIQAFREIKRARFSLWLLLIIYGLSLLSNLVANDKPLLVHANGTWYAPVFFFVPEDAFLKNGRSTRPDYKMLATHDLFAEGSGNRIIWPLVPYGPNEGLRVEEIDLEPSVDVHLRSTEQVARVDLSSEGGVLRVRNGGWLGESLSKDANLIELFPPSFREAVHTRFSNRPGEELRFATNLNGKALEVQLNRFTPRTRSPRSVRLNVREILEQPVNARFRLMQGAQIPVSVSEEDRSRLLGAVDELIGAGGAVQNLDLSSGLKATLEREQVSFPFRPVTGHPFGLDSSGRDVFVRVLYATQDGPQQHHDI